MLLCACACVSGFSTAHTNTPVLPQPVIWLSSKPATTGEDNSFVSCCRHVTIPHLILSQLAGRDGEEEGSESLTVSNCYTPPPPSYLSLFYFPLFCQCLFSHSKTLSLSIAVSQVYYVNIKCWTAPASLAAFPHLRLFPLR